MTVRINCTTRQLYVTIFQKIENARVGTRIFYLVLAEVCASTVILLLIRDIFLSEMIHERLIVIRKSKQITSNFYIELLNISSQQMPSHFENSSSSIVEVIGFRVDGF